MCDRRLVRDGFARGAIQTILQNGMQGGVRTGVDLKGAFAGGFQAIAAKSLAQPDDTQAGAEALFRVFAFAHHDLDKGLGVGANPGGLTSDTFR